jgi:hypothetical protein
LRPTHGSYHVCENSFSKPVWTFDDTFSKFMDPKIGFQKYMDLFENAEQV